MTIRTSLKGLILGALLAVAGATGAVAVHAAMNDNDPARQEAQVNTPTNDEIDTARHTITSASTANNWPVKKVANPMPDFDGLTVTIVAVKPAPDLEATIESLVDAPSVSSTAVGTTFPARTN